MPHLQTYIQALQKHSTIVLVTVCAMLLLSFSCFYLQWIQGFAFGWAIACILTGIYLLTAWYFRRRWLSTKELLQTICLHVGTVAVLMLMIGILGDQWDVAYYKYRIKSLMADGRYEQALTIGERSDKSDAELLKLRVEALGKVGQLGEHLFEYPIVGSGAPYINKGGDEMLCGLLIDKRLDDFVEALLKTHPINETLPKHYREALILYRHKRLTPKVVFRSSVMDTDFRDLQTLEDQYQNETARKGAVHDMYEGTYWYYYLYQ